MKSIIEDERKKQRKEDEDNAILRDAFDDNDNVNDIMGSSEFYDSMARLRTEDPELFGKVMNTEHFKRVKEIIMSGIKVALDGYAEKHRDDAPRPAPRPVPAPKPRKPEADYLLAFVKEYQQILKHEVNTYIDHREGTTGTQYQTIVDYCPNLYIAIKDMINKRNYDHKMLTKEFLSIGANKDFIITSKTRELINKDAKRPEPASPAPPAPEPAEEHEQYEVIEEPITPPIKKEGEGLKIRTGKVKRIYPKRKLAKIKIGGAIDTKKMIDGLLNRLKSLMGLRGAGNNSKEICNEASDISSFLYKNKVLTKPIYKNIQKSIL
jgi:hypothetical protein